jgi:hypothetical protein
VKKRVGLRTIVLIAAIGLLPPAIPARAASGGADGEVAARIGDQTISVKDLDGQLQKSNPQAFQAFYDARRAALEQLIAERILEAEAASRGVTPEQLQQEIVAGVGAVSDADVENFFNQNKARMGDRTLDQLREQIRNYLVGTNRQRAYGDFIGKLREKKGVQILLEPPRADVKIADSDPVKGPAGAPVQIVEYSDFQ